MSGTTGSTCPERLGNAGFRSGRRFVAVRAPKQFFVLYEAKSPDTVSGPEYMNNVRFNSEWSQRQVLLNNNRAIFRVLFSLGSGQGGSILSLRYRVSEGREEEQRRLLAHDLLPKLVDRHFELPSRADRQAGDACLGEPGHPVQGQSRPGDRAGVADPDRRRPRCQLAGRCGTGARHRRGAGRGPGTIQSGLYDLEYGLFRIAAGLEAPRRRPPGGGAKPELERSCCPGTRCLPSRSLARSAQGAPPGRPPSPCAAGRRGSDPRGGGRVDRADVLQRSGRYPPPPGASDLPGLEVAGEVVASTAMSTGRCRATASARW